MGNNKDPNKTRPGEMPPGKFHFNPGRYVWQENWKC